MGLRELMVLRLERLLEQPAFRVRPQEREVV